MRVAAEYSAKHMVQRSRFHALLLPAASEAEVKDALVRRRKEFKKACHHCWAARLVSPDGAVVELCRDDGEVGRPGHKILELLQRSEVEGALIVSRIFGGVKLGPGGVGRAFQRAAQAVLEQAGLP